MKYLLLLVIFAFWFGWGTMLINDKINGIRQAQGYTSAQVDRLLDEQALNDGTCQLKDFQILSVKQAPWRGETTLNGKRVLAQDYFIDVSWCDSVLRRIKGTEVVRTISPQELEQRRIDDQKRLDEYNRKKAEETK